MPVNTAVAELGLDEYKYGFRDEVEYLYKSKKGLDEEIVRTVSAQKNEPEWMLKNRLKALKHAQGRPWPKWGGDLSGLNFDEIFFYIRPSEKTGRTWDEVPETIKNTFERLGIPDQERRILAGVGAQYESEVVYHSLKKEWEDQGVIFKGMDDGLREHEDLVREYFGTVVPFRDNLFAAVNAAVWSGGSFVYIPKGVKLEQPLQAYFRINEAQMGQFERTLIIVEEGAQVQYIEGCTAPSYAQDSFHSGVIEIIVKDNARCRYTTIQNWSHNVYNLVTQRAVVGAHGTMEWVDGNLGSKLTMKYPSCYLNGEGARGEILSIAYAGPGQHQDAGGKVVHNAPYTSSRIVSKSISRGSGRSSYRGLLKVEKGAHHVRSNVECDALLLDEEARTDTYPYIEIGEEHASIGHEATVSKIGDEQLFYLMSRGLSEDEAATMVVRGFIEPIAKELPLEYAVELNKLIELEMEGSVG
ncbi:MAG: Fe-S cluster assembly protein SufB [Gemmatimonadetes bacterium]|nr:Fe-S cluster assembly protein SufB [Gemmatimonadota bacterium]MDQ3310335.1 Fe-S cluster assembly protein SufB [Gemmatimonadota bacterium]